MTAPRNNIEHSAQIGDVLSDIVEAGFQGNTRRLELAALTAIRLLRGSSPEAANAINKVLASNRKNGTPTRGMAIEPSPVDQDSSAPLLRVEAPRASPKPIFNPEVQSHLSRFVTEWVQKEKLLAEGLTPPRSMLLKGPPGTGKTMLATWLSGELGLKFVALDLATSISSYLGKTGMNLRRALDYARATPCVLLLDEFDSIAKRRDDTTEVGELKRIVNVLLKELEDWPAHSLLIAATNHPELLDPAISRRFDRVLITGMPNHEERKAILQNSLGRFDSGLRPAVIEAVTRMFEGRSGSDIHVATSAAVRRHIVAAESLELALIAEAKSLLGDDQPKALGQVIRALRGSGQNPSLSEKLLIWSELFHQRFTTI